MDMGEWLTAIAEHVEHDHPCTAWLDKPVALALAEGRTIVPGLSDGLFRLGVERLIGDGYLDDVLEMNHGDGWTEHILEYRLPSKIPTGSSGAAPSEEPAPGRIPMDEFEQEFVK
jgi:hypothetical protein